MEGSIQQDYALLETIVHWEGRLTITPDRGAADPADFIRHPQTAKHWRVLSLDE